MDPRYQPGDDGKAYPERPEIERDGAVRKEPYFGSPVLACPACGYLSTVGLPHCPRCNSPLPRPPSAIGVWVVATAVAGASWALGLPWDLALLAGGTVAALGLWRVGRKSVRRQPGQPL